MDDRRHTWESEDTELSVTHSFAPDVAEIAGARRAVRDQLAAWGLERDQMALELAVSELVTNAIVHGRGRVDLCISLARGRVRLDVSDEGPGAAPGPDGGDGTTVGGWGLRLIDDMSDDWGTGREGDRAHVWMERRAEGRQRDVGPPPV